MFFERSATTVIFTHYLDLDAQIQMKRERLEREKNQWKVQDEKVQLMRAGTAPPETAQFLTYVLNGS